MKWLGVLVCLSIELFASSYGETLFQGNCVSCHDTLQTISAPAMKEVQSVYKQRFTTKEAFKTFMVTWISKPSEKEALMPSAIKKHGLMPQLGYDKPSLESIAEFLYDAHF